MSEESKTARAARLAVERGQQSGRKELTTEERLANLKKNLDAGLYIPATEVKLLWDKYVESLAEILGSRAALSVNALALDAQIEQNERWQDEFGKMVEIRDIFVKENENLKEQLRDLQC